jgi:3-methylfumaryl-CoA hydratase
MATELQDMQDWVGRQQTVEALVTAYQANVLAATLDRDDPPFRDGDALPPGWQVMYIRDVTRLKDSAEDGHPMRGGEFAPPIPLPRRMWAGTKTTYHQPVMVGETIVKTTTIKAITPKTGKTGQLVFIKLTAEIAGASGVAVTEEQDVVYREMAKPGTAPPQPQPAPTDPAWSRVMHPSPVLLFRWSALTMNSHRIHYDRPYVTGVEGYPGLLVQGSFTQVLLLDLFRREMPQATLKTFDVRAVSSLYDNNDFFVEGAPGADGRSASLWTRNHQGGLAMTAQATFEP